jgi:hypothetical protein
VGSRCGGSSPRPTPGSNSAASTPHFQSGGLLGASRGQGASRARVGVKRCFSRVGVKSRVGASRASRGESGSNVVFGRVGGESGSNVVFCFSGESGSRASRGQTLFFVSWPWPSRRDSSMARRSSRRTGVSSLSLGPNSPKHSGPAFSLWSKRRFQAWSFPLRLVRHLGPKRSVSQSVMRSR